NDAATAIHDAAGVATELPPLEARRFGLGGVGPAFDDLAILEPSLQHTAVLGHAALAMNRTAAGRIPLAGRELERGAAIEAEGRLHESLAERRGAEHQRAIMVLQRAGHDLRGRRRSAVGEYHERHALRDVWSARTRDLVGRGPASDRDDILAVLE